MKTDIIKKMTIELGKKNVDLTMDEARALHKALSEMFAGPVKEVIERHDHHHHHSYPWRWDYYSPVYCTSDNTKFTLANDGGTIQCSLNAT